MGTMPKENKYQNDSHLKNIGHIDLVFDVHTLEPSVHIPCATL